MRKIEYFLMFAANKFLTLSLIATFLFLNGVHAEVRYIEKPDSDYIHVAPPKYGRELDDYMPHLSNETVTLRGSAALGYYYATLFFGFPPQKQTVIVDTGSSITAIPCHGSFIAFNIVVMMIFTDRMHALWNESLES